MKNISITLPDKSKHEYARGTTPLQIAESISPGLARATVAAKIDGVVRDATFPIEKDSDVILLKGDSPEGHEVLLHSTAHLMAQAVKELFPDAKVTSGPASEKRYYYDFDIDGTFSEDDLKRIEEKMRELAKQKIPVHRKELSRNEAVELFSGMNESYKVEILEAIPEDETISAYQQDGFLD